MGRENLEDTGVKLQNRKIKGSAAKIVDGHLGAVLELVEAVGECGGGGFAEDAEDFETGEFTGAFGGVALCVVEVSGDGDDGL